VIVPFGTNEKIYKFLSIRAKRGLFIDVFSTVIRIHYDL